GLVMFTNGERGDQILYMLDKLTLQVNTDSKDHTQYPNLLFEVLNVYNNEGYPAAFNHLKLVLAKLDVDMKEELKELGYLFLQKQPEFAIDIARAFKDRYPSSQDAFILHGNVMMKNQQFKAAIHEFERAKELENTSSEEDLENLIKRCYELIGEKE
ncbi:MAG: hypothetical protein C0490_11035, partial [Marivirga sp.]|nr:hypothetical protein [Marivirga sp.]